LHVVATVANVGYALLLFFRVSSVCLSHCQVCGQRLLPMFSFNRHFFHGLANAYSVSNQGCAKWNVDTILQLKFFPAHPSSLNISIVCMELWFSSIWICFRKQSALGHQMWTVERVCWVFLGLSNSPGPQRQKLLPKILELESLLILKLVLNL